MTTALVRVCLCLWSLMRARLTVTRTACRMRRSVRCRSAESDRSARGGSDGVFDTADDSVYLAVLRSPYSSGTTLDFEILDGPWEPASIGSR